MRCFVMFVTAVCILFLLNHASFCSILALDLHVSYCKVCLFPFFALAITCVTGSQLVDIQNLCDVYLWSRNSGKRWGGGGGVDMLEKGKNCSSE